MFRESAVNRGKAAHAGLGYGSLKHGISFDLARTAFDNPRLLSIADLEHSEAEERWFSIGCASNGMLLSVVYVWLEGDPGSV